jgi:hypothetical protein
MFVGTDILLSVMTIFNFHQAFGHRFDGDAEMA